MECVLSHGCDSWLTAPCYGRSLPPQYLYTLCVKENEKAEKLAQSLPPGTLMSACCGLGNAIRHQLQSADPRAAAAVPLTRSAARGHPQEAVNCPHLAPQQLVLRLRDACALVGAGACYRGAHRLVAA